MRDALAYKKAGTSFIVQLCTNYSLQYKKAGNSLRLIKVVVGACTTAAATVIIGVGGHIETS